MLFKKIIKAQDSKSKIVLKNAFFSFFIKGLNVGTSFLTVPLVLTFLNNTQYGIWLTLTSILGWFSVFDLGFGNGLRNHLTVSIANKQYVEGKIYVSTTYAALSVIFGSLIVIFLVVHSFVSWTAVFNAPAAMSADINSAVVFAICFLFVQFVVKLINTVLLSYQRAAMADLTNALVQVIILIGLYFLKITGHKSLTDVAILYSVTPVVLFLGVNILLFSRSYPQISPSFKFVRSKYVNNLMRLGLNFFVIQVAALVLYASDNFLITQLIAPKDVPPYSIAYKYFSIETTLFTIIITPFWSMVTKAFAEGDITWIKKAVKNILIIWMLLSAVAVMQLVVAKPFYRIWTHDRVSVPFIISVIVCIYSINSNVGSVFASFLNGVGKVRLQLYVAVVSMFVNIPLSIFFVKVLHTGVAGIPLATTITVIVGNAINSVQYWKIINFKARGIWNR